MATQRPIAGKYRVTAAHIERYCSAFSTPMSSPQMIYGQGPVCIENRDARFKVGDVIDTKNFYYDDSIGQWKASIRKGEHDLSGINPWVSIPTSKLVKVADSIAATTIDFGVSVGSSPGIPTKAPLKDRLNTMFQSPYFWAVVVLIVVAYYRLAK